jgi:hypothetical protein
VGMTFWVDFDEIVMILIFLRHDCDFLRLLLYFCLYILELLKAIGSE